MLAMVVTGIASAWYGGTAVAVRVGSQIESLSWLIGGGFSSAITAFVGQIWGTQMGTYTPRLSHFAECAIYLGDAGYIAFASGRSIFVFAFSS